MRASLFLLAYTVTTLPVAAAWIQSSSCCVRSSDFHLYASDPRLNPLLEKIEPSKTVEIFSLVKQMEAEGQKVTSLCVGEPDYPPPAAVMEAITTADTKYTALTGTLELRKAIANDLNTRKNVRYTENEIVVANGAKQAVYQGVLATVGSDDKVLIPAPYWPSYPEMVNLVGATPVIVETKAENGFLLTPDQLREALEEHQPKLLIFCNPSNPTGGVYQKEQLEGICQVLREFPDVLVLADEIYERLVYGGLDCPSVASFDGMFERTMTVNGFSKSHAMTGFRLGYLAAPQALSKAVATIQSQLTSCASSIAQAAGVAALNVDEKILDDNILQLQEKRDYVLGELDTMPGIEVAVPPRGAFYVLPRLLKSEDDVQVCRDLLTEKQLALVPGSSFGAPGTVRISYATSMEELQEAMGKLRSYLEAKS